MSWHKLGCVLPPQPEIWWMSHSCAAAYMDPTDTTSVVWVTGRDHLGISRIGKVQLDPDDPSRVVRVDPEPTLGIGKPGTFDENGVSYPFSISNNDEKYLFYTGWVQGGRGGFQTHLGLAKLDQQSATYERLSQAPIFERTDREPIGTGSMFILKHENIFKMWYTCFERWIAEGDKLKPSYWIKYAESQDLVSWSRLDHVCISGRSTEDYITSKPTILFEDGVFKMWYSHRGSAYRIGYAESADGKTWTRLDHLVNLDVSKESWDSDMLCYPFVFYFQNKKYMFYNGNGFGRSGLGLAVWKAQ